MKTLLTSTLALLALAVTPTARAAVTPLSAQPTASAALFETAAPLEAQPEGKSGATPVERDPIYADGMKAMDEGRWSDAVTFFDRVATQHGDRAEAALYWKAYSLEKLNRKEEARATCNKLQSTRPASTWNRECTMLRLQNGTELVKLKQLSGPDAEIFLRTWSDGKGDIKIQEALENANLARLDANHVYTYRGYKETPHDPNDDIKLIALNALMGQEPAKAVPALRNFILSTKSEQLRRHALFILSRSKAPEAQALLTEVANNKSDIELQKAAVQTLAIGRGKQAAPELVNIYRNSADKGVKRAAVSGLFTTQDAPHLVELARGEKDLELKREIVSQIALMHDPAATAFMEELLK